MTYCSLRLAVPALVAAAMFAGCSADRQVVRSTAAAPATVSIVDTVTRQALWSMEVPPAHTLVLDADNRHDIGAMRQGNSPATSVKWKLYETATAESAWVDSNRYLFKPTVERGKVELSGNPVLIDVALAGVSMGPSLPTDAPAATPVSVEAQMQDAADAAEPMPADTK